MTPGEDRMDDTALDREVESLLSVEPSVEFQARIRARVATETVSRTGAGWWGRPAWQVAFALAAGVVLVLAVIRFGHQTPEQQVRIDRTVERVEVEPRIPPTPAADGHTATRPVVPPAPPANGDRRTRLHVSEPPIQVAVAAVPATRDPFSDVLVSAREVKALRQIAAMLSPDEKSEVARPAAPTEISELVIAPITVAPIQLRPLEGEAE
jgi:hypothetical protein